MLLQYYIHNYLYFIVNAENRFLGYANKKIDIQGDQWRDVRHSSLFLANVFEYHL